MNKPTMIIGLGGSGSRIAETVWQKISEQQKNSIPFVCIDTEYGELEDIRDKTPAIHTICLMRDFSVTDGLFPEENAGNHWYPKYPVLKEDRDSLRYLRAAGRLCFHMAVRRGKLQILDSILKNLSQAGDDQTLQVILTGSMCGYTGSALILPVSLYIRDYVKTELPDTSVSIAGFFLLPEVFDPIIHSEKEREHKKVNAYAAIRELHAFTLASAGCLPDRYDFSFYMPCFRSDRTKELSGRPMDRCFLFSGRKGNGLPLPTFTDCTDYAADGILSVLSVTDSDMSTAFSDPDISVLEPSLLDPSAMQECAKHYSAAYHDLIRQLETSGRTGWFITPHLDRRWHDPAVMPDLDDDS